jgi:hypothetical protein
MESSRTNKERAVHLIDDIEVWTVEDCVKEFKVELDKV